MESDLAVLAADQAMVGDSHPVGVAAYIAIDLFGAPEGFFGVDDPF